MSALSSAPYGLYTRSYTKKMYKALAKILANAVQRDREMLCYHLLPKPNMYGKQALNDPNNWMLRAVSLALASGVSRDALVCIPEEFDAHQRQRVAQEFEPALQERARSCAALDLARDRMATICFALEDLRLPALLTVMILEEACTPPGANLLFHHVWRVATVVKHRIVS